LIGQTGAVAIFVLPGRTVNLDFHIGSIPTMDRGWQLVSFSCPANWQRKRFENCKMRTSAHFGGIMDTKWTKVHVDGKQTIRIQKGKASVEFMASPNFNREVNAHFDRLCEQYPDAARVFVIVGADGTVTCGVTEYK
jgi:hypothetical protein